MNSDLSTGRQPPSGVCGVGARTDAENNAWCDRWAAEIGRRIGEAKTAAGLPPIPLLLERGKSLLREQNRRTIP